MSDTVTIKDIVELRELYTMGLNSISELAVSYGTTEDNVERLVRNLQVMTDVDPSTYL